VSEVGKHLFYRGENVALFSAADMAMIALASFVVVTHALFASRAVEQSVLVQMSARRHWGRQIPDNDFDDRAVIVHFMRAGSQGCGHVTGFGRGVVVCK
jgi:hypothetical protein